MERWKSFPTWWVRKGMLTQMSATSATTGHHIAALKIFLAIAITADFPAWTSEISYKAIMDLTDLSRPMISKGIRRLEDLGIVEVDRSGYRSSYKLLQLDSETHWMKLPTAAIRQNLRNISNGDVTALAALKQYLVMLTVRQRGSHEAPISHVKLQKHTGVRPSLIAKGTSHLIAHGLVRFANKPAYTDAGGHPVNTYYLLGVLSENDSDEDQNVGQAAYKIGELTAEPSDAALAESASVNQDLIAGVNLF